MSERRRYPNITVQNVVKEVLVEGKTQAAVSRRRRIPAETINTWVIAAQRGDAGFLTRMDRHAQQRQEYAPELKKEVIHRTQRLGEKSREVAQALNIPYGTVTHWVAVWKNEQRIQLQRPGYGRPELSLIGI